MRRELISFASGTDQNPLTILASAEWPAADDPYRVVLVLHGSAGMDSRGKFYGAALHQAGIGTLEPDFIGPRQIARRDGGRSAPGVAHAEEMRTASEFLQPLVDVERALQEIGRRAEGREARVGILGFSWGATLAVAGSLEWGLRSGRMRSNEQVQIRACAALYPLIYVIPDALINGYSSDGCAWLIVSGDQDSFTDPSLDIGFGQKLQSRGATKCSVEIIPGAYHGFDRLEGELKGYHELARGGAGGDVIMRPNGVEAHRIRTEVVEFFLESL